MKRIRWVGAATIGVLVVSATALTSAADAEPGDDAATVVENLPAAVDHLLAGLQGAVDVLVETHERGSRPPRRWARPSWPLARPRSTAPTISPPWA